ncbi:MAG TPA: hypothetical protein VN684_00575 [Terriglobales bacterium]|nr:hypothetical protein [Terriglobales bacterium]
MSNLSGPAAGITMTNPLDEYFRCASVPIRFGLTNELSRDAGYFQFGPGTICFGRSSAGFRSKRPDEKLYDVGNDVVRRDEMVLLPFDPCDVANGLRGERYVISKGSGQKQAAQKMMRDAYYSLRPFMPLGFRKHLQRLHLNGWEKIPFPTWPVDRTTDSIFEKLLVLALKSEGLKEIPFIWFWPDGAQGAAVMTHDVETELGRVFCSELMDINDQFQVPASFQVVPEKRYPVPQEYLREIEERGYEVNVQDLNHDGRLFDDYQEFTRRAAKINEYGKQYRAAGFRSAILYRKQEWYGHLDFEYDMSVPNVAHLDPQRGGCCTVMPYFVGNMVELPVTLTQDHTLFNILKDYSLDLWKRQTELILRQHGLLNFIVHPDYIIAKRPQDTYKSLLGYLSELRAERGLWIAHPREVSRWWKQRKEMKLERQNGGWAVEGAGKERARIAFARLDGGELVYTLEDKMPKQ